MTTNNRGSLLVESSNLLDKTFTDDSHLSLKHRFLDRPKTVTIINRVKPFRYPWLQHSPNLSTYPIFSRGFAGFHGNTYSVLSVLQDIRRDQEYSNCYPLNHVTLKIWMKLDPLHWPNHDEEHLMIWLKLYKISLPHMKKNLFASTSNVTPSKQSCMATHSTQVKGIISDFLPT